MKYYKIVGHNAEAIHGGSGTWYLPNNGKPGEWMPAVEGDIRPCKNGYHLCRRGDLIHWLKDGRIFEAEGRGDRNHETDKTVFRQARLIREMHWNDGIARHFASDCAMHVLPIFEKQYPDDSRVRDCVETGWKVANGDLPVRELAAAWAAARAAAWDACEAAAAGAAARAAVWASDAAAGVAAKAGNAAGNAARAGQAAAAGAVEEKWQTRRLFEYLEGKRP